MEITEVRIKLMDDPHDRLQAFCSITFDGCFVVRDLKIIQGAKGAFVAMPSRKLTDKCPNCSSKNHLRALYCGQCGSKLDEERAAKDEEGRAKLYADIAHPINSRCREMIQDRVLAEFEHEQVRSKEPGYVCTYDDYDSDDEDYGSREQPQTSQAPAAGGNDSPHRVEPAAGTPGPPHHGRVGKPHEGAHADRPRGREHSGGDDETFGAGLV